MFATRLIFSALSAPTLRVLAMFICEWETPHLLASRAPGSLISWKYRRISGLWLSGWVSGMAA